MKSWNYISVDKQSNGYESVLDKLKTYTKDKYALMNDDERKVVVNEVFDIYRSINVYPITYYNKQGIHDEIAKCIAKEVSFTDNVLNLKFNQGQSLCRFLMPNLHKVQVKGANKNSLHDRFYDDHKLKRAIDFCLRFKKSVSPAEIRTAIEMIGGGFATNYKTMNAKALYERYTPQNGIIYDFACVDDETEYFNGYEWKSLKDYDGGKVLQYNEDGTSELVQPLDYIHYKSDKPFYLFDNGKHLNTCLTGNHNIVYRKRLKDTDKTVESYKTLSSECYRIKQEDILNKDFRGRVPLSFNYSGNYEVEENLLRLIVAVQADGSLCKDGSVNTIRFGMSKERKIERLKWLLEVNNIEYTTKVRLYKNEKHTNALDFKFKNKYIYELLDNGNKTFPKEYYDLNKESKDVFLAELCYWDGSINSYGGREYYSCNKHNAELVQFLFSSNNKGSYIHIDDRRNEKGRENSSVCYTVGEYSESYCTSSYKSKNGFKEIYKEDKYCFTVDSHMLVLRRSGKIFITGNCGFGGRMLGALSSKNNYTYIAVEPCVETFANLNKLGTYIEEVTQRKDSYELHCVGSEDFVGEPNSVDFAFSSPPYFNLEHYSEEETQCYVKYPTLNEWFEGYVKSTIKNIHTMLKDGSHYAVNIADFKNGKSEVKFVDKWIELSEELGFTFVDEIHMKLQGRVGVGNTKDKREGIFVFKK